MCPPSYSGYSEKSKSICFVVQHHLSNEATPVIRTPLTSLRVARRLVCCSVLDMYQDSVFVVGRLSMSLHVVHVKKHSHSWMALFIRGYILASHNCMIVPPPFRTLTLEWRRQLLSDTPMSCMEKVRIDGLIG